VPKARTSSGVPGHVARKSFEIVLSVTPFPAFPGPVVVGKASSLKQNPWLTISIQEQDHELTITDYLSLKCSPSWLLCNGISDDFLGVNGYLSVRLHKSRYVSIADRMYVFTFLTLMNQISPITVYTGMVKRMMSTVATLGYFKAFYLSNFVCPVGSLACPLRQTPKSLYAVQMP